MEFMDRIISPTLLGEENEDITIRPSLLTEFVGQEQLKKSLEIFIGASRKRGEPLEHILFSGPPGIGKTTLAYIIAREMGIDIKATSGPLIQRPGDLIAILASLKRGEVLFIDEVHRLKHTIEEILYTAMEDFVLDFVADKGQEARSIKINLAHFTIIGATTRIGLLSSPFRDRFGFAARLSLYSIDELIQVINRSAVIYGVPITADGVLSIAKRSRGTPRIANRLLRRVRDFASMKGEKEVGRDIADVALSMLGIDELGLDDLDRQIIKVIEDFGGGPVGLKTIAISIGEDPGTVEDVYEPYLIHLGFIKRTHQGRETTDAARYHIFDKKDFKKIRITKI